MPSRRQHEALCRIALGKFHAMRIVVHAVEALLQRPLYLVALASSVQGQGFESLVRRPGWDLNPRGPKDQQLAWSNSLRSRGSTPGAPKWCAGSVAVPGSATRATGTRCLPRINVVLWNLCADPLIEGLVGTLSMIVLALHRSILTGCIGSCEIS